MLAREPRAPGRGAAGPIRRGPITDDKGHHREHRLAGYTVAFAETQRDASAGDDAGHPFMSCNARFAAKDPPVTQPTPIRLSYASRELPPRACDTGGAAPSKVRGARTRRARRRRQGEHR